LVVNGAEAEAFDEAWRAFYRQLPRDLHDEARRAMRARRNKPAGCTEVYHDRALQSATYDIPAQSPFGKDLAEDMGLSGPAHDGIVLSAPGLDAEAGALVCPLGSCPPLPLDLLPAVCARIVAEELLNYRGIPHSQGDVDRLAETWGFHTEQLDKALGIQRWRWHWGGRPIPDGA
jgi:hypothetical protein